MGKTETILASATHQLEKQDIAAFFDMMLRQNARRSKRYVDAAFIVCDVLFTLCAVYLLVVDQNRNPFFIAFLVMVWLLVLLRFFRIPLYKRRYVSKHYSSFVENTGERDHTDFYKDRLVVHQSESKIEFSYSDILELWETDTLVIFRPRSGMIHLLRKDRFTRNSFELVRPYLNGIRKISAS